LRHRSMASTACFLSLILTWRTKIFGLDWSILTSDRSPETFETRIGSLAMVPVTFYSKTREGKTASVGGCERTKYWSRQICKRNKKVLIITWLKSILLSIQLMQQRRRTKNIWINEMNLSFRDWFQQQMTSSTSTYRTYKCFHSFLTQITSTV
jgi:hypothetical protein